MATININIKEFAIAGLLADLTGVRNTTSLLKYVDMVSGLGLAFAMGHPTLKDVSNSKEGVQMTFSDGATLAFNGLSTQSTIAGGTSTTAAIKQITMPKLYQLTNEGTLTLASNAAGRYDETSATLSSSKLALTLPDTAAEYDKFYGNAEFDLVGAMKYDGQGNFSGTLNEIAKRNERVIVETKMTGSFNVTGSSYAITQGASTTKVSGIVTGYSEKYIDDSIIEISGLKSSVVGESTISARMILNGANFPGDDTINVTMPTMSQQVVIASGAGNDKISLKGGGGNLWISAGEGNDTITLADTGHGVFGGAGFDTVVINDIRANNTVTKVQNNYVIKSAAGTNGVVDVERIAFTDATVALDIDGAAGKAYRIYKAAFNRVPDEQGLGFWIAQMDKGMSVNALAEGFMSSKEYQELYPSTLTNAQLVEKYYENVLGRAPEKAGLDFWAGVLDSHSATVAEVLANISESAENKAGVLGLIGQGFAYIPYA